MSLVARELESENEDEPLKTPEFLPEEAYSTSYKEAMENDKQAFKYSLNVIIKLESTIHDIYMV